MFKSTFAMMLLCLSFMASAGNMNKSAEFATMGEAKDVSQILKMYSDEGVQKEDGIQDFTLLNRTGMSICRVHVSPSYSDNWEEDILGSRTMANNASMLITIDGYGDHCEFDVRVVACNNAYVDRRLDLCQVSTYTVY